MTLNLLIKVIVGTGIVLPLAGLKAENINAFGGDANQVYESYLLCQADLAMMSLLYHEVGVEKPGFNEASDRHFHQLKGAGAAIGKDTESIMKDLSSRTSQLSYEMWQSPVTEEARDQMQLTVMNRSRECLQKIG
jgi:hypothetical protein